MLAVIRKSSYDLGKKAEDNEKSNRHNKIRIIWLPEGTESQDLVEFFILLQILEIQEKGTDSK